MTKKKTTQKTKKAKKATQPVIILTDIYLVKEESKLKSFLKKVCYFFKCK